MIPAIIILLAVMVILLWRQRTPRTISVDILQQQALSSNLPFTNITGKQIFTNTQSHAEPPTNQLIINDTRPSPESIRGAMESINVPVEFYGKIVDQDGAPLADARVLGETLHLKVVAPIPGGAQDEIIPIDQKTGPDGRFEIRGITGRAVQIESIQKDGYEMEPTPRNHNVTEGSFSSPVIFKMWSSNIHEQLITGGNKFEIVPDGRPYFINLTSGTIAESGSGDLKVWIKYPAQVTHGQWYDWSCEIDAINGGLSEQSLGTVLYLAPTDGYLPSFQLQQQIKGGQYGEIGERHFYVKLKGGKEYGQIAINLCAPYTDQIPGLIRLSYVVNPSGSRILH